MSIKIGILGYGNLGRGVECAVKQNDDMELAGSVYKTRLRKQCQHSDRECNSL